MPNRILVVLTVAFALVLSAALFAQRGTAGRAQVPGRTGRAQLLTPVQGTLTGTVRDQAGAVLPGVQVTVTLQSDANVQPNRVTTDQEGRFRFNELPLGNYRLEAVLPGFRRLIQSDIAVRGSQAANVSLTLFRATASLPPISRRGGPPPVVIATPTPMPTPAPIVLPTPTPTAGPETRDGNAVIPVFYATDRARTAEPALNYGVTRSPEGKLWLGRYDISIPFLHEAGRVERPTIWTFYREDPNKHFVILGRKQQSYDEFYDDIRGVVNRSTHRDALVFIHGFNVAFEEAVFRTAQMAHDLKFKGAPILYSWPSNTGENPIGYNRAQENCDWAARHLDYFLRDVTEKTGATRIHLVAHSMGNRALVNALSRWPPSDTRKFNQIVLTAPDMDADTFVELAAAVTRNGERTTLYASASDKALLVSKQLNGFRRAGDVGDGILVIPGIDTVDVTAIDSDFVGHFYYGDNRSVISDIFLLFSQGLPPVSRPSLRQDGVAPKLFWKFAR
jgi:esterase/lipase superfamily enzyme